MTGLTLQPSLEASVTVTHVIFPLPAFKFATVNWNLQIDPSAAVPLLLSAMSTVTRDEPSSSTLCGDLHTGDTSHEPSLNTICGDLHIGDSSHEPSFSTLCGDLHTDDTIHELEDAILIDDEEEHYSTGYSEFCDDDTIMLAPDTICNEVDSSPTGSSPATILGKRKSPEDSGLPKSVYASYKRHTSTGSDSAESSTEPYIIVSLEQSSLSVPNIYHFRQQAHNTSVQRVMDDRGLPWGVQWEVARLVSRGHCTWSDISMSRLDHLREEALRKERLPHDTPLVPNNPIAPYIEDLFRWNKESFGHQRSSKEFQATVCYNCYCVAYNLVIVV